jgi:hypothetical protein
MEEAVRIAENTTVGKFASTEVRPEMKIGWNVGYSRRRTRKMYQDHDASCLIRLGEESGQVSCDRRRFLRRGEVPAARKDCPTLDVVHALQI